MAICPATLKPCIDDLCYGSGCLALGGETMLKKCTGCGQLVGIDGCDPYDACQCLPDSWYGMSDDERHREAFEATAYDPDPTRCDECGCPAACCICQRPTCWVCNCDPCDCRSEEEDEGEGF